VDGHSIEQLYTALNNLRNDNHSQPRALIANTIKGKGVPKLESDPICHIKSLSAEEIDSILKEWE
jgi:transketolase